MYIILFIYKYKSTCVCKVIEKLWKKIHQFIIVVTSAEKEAMRWRRRRRLSTPYLNFFFFAIKMFSGIFGVILNVNSNKYKYAPVK